MSMQYTKYTVIPEIQSLSTHLSAFNQAYKIQRRSDRLFLMLIIGMMIALLYVLLIMVLATKYSIEQQDGTVNYVVFLLVGVLLVQMELYQWFKATQKTHRLKEMLVTDVNFDRHFGKIKVEGYVPDSILVGNRGSVYTADSYARIDKGSYILVGDYCLFHTGIGFTLYTKTNENIQLQKGREDLHASKDV